MSDIEQSKKVVGVLADMANAVEKVVKESGGVLAKASHLLPLSGDLIALASVDFSALKAELASLDDAESAALVQVFKDKFDLADDVLEGKIEAAVDLALESEQLVAKVIAFAKSLKAAPVA